MSLQDQTERDWSRYGPSGDRTGVLARARHLWLMLAVSAVVAGIGAAVGAITSSGSGALGVAAGVILVAVSFTATTLAAAWADSVAPRLVLIVGMAVYLVKVAILTVVLLSLGASTWPGKIPVAIGILVGVVAWVAAQIWWIVHREYPYRGGP